MREVLRDGEHGSVTELESEAVGPSCRELLDTPKAGTASGLDLGPLNEALDTQVFPGREAPRWCQDLGLIQRATEELEHEFGKCTGPVHGTSAYINVHEHPSLPRPHALEVASPEDNTRPDTDRLAVGEEAPDIEGPLHGRLVAHDNIERLG